MKAPNHFKGFQTWGCLLNEDRTSRFLILLYVNITSILWDYVWRLVFVQPTKQLESGNKIPVTQIAPREKKDVNASNFEILCSEKSIYGMHACSINCKGYCF